MLTTPFPLLLAPLTPGLGWRGWECDVGPGVLRPGEMRPLGVAGVLMPPLVPGSMGAMLGLIFGRSIGETSCAEAPGVGRFLVPLVALPFGPVDDGVVRGD